VTLKTTNLQSSGTPDSTPNVTHTILSRVYFLLTLFFRVETRQRRRVEHELRHPALQHPLAQHPYRRREQPLEERVPRRRRPYLGGRRRQLYQLQHQPRRVRFDLQALMEDAPLGQLVGQTDVGQSLVAHGHHVGQFRYEVGRLFRPPGGGFRFDAALALQTAQLGVIRVGAAVYRGEGAVSGDECVELDQRLHLQVHLGDLGLDAVVVGVVLDAGRLHHGHVEGAVDLARGRVLLFQLDDLATMFLVSV
jgi:hypothetical protein